MKVKSLTTGLISFALSFSIASAFDAHISGDSLVITDSNKRFAIPDVVDNRPIATCIHAYQKRGDDLFVVFGAREWSRGSPPRSGLGGAGVESRVVWMHIRDQKIVDTREGLYESFWDNRSGKPPKWKDGKLHWGVGYLRPRIRGSIADFAEQILWTYDPAKPEKGIHEEKRRVPIR